MEYCRHKLNETHASQSEVKFREQAKMKVNSQFLKTHYTALEHILYTYQEPLLLTYHC